MPPSGTAGGEAVLRAFANQTEPIPSPPVSGLRRSQTTAAEAVMETLNNAPSPDRAPVGRTAATRVRPLMSLLQSEAHDVSQRTRWRHSCSTTRATGRVNLLVSSGGFRPRRSSRQRHQRRTLRELTIDTSKDYQLQKGTRSEPTSVGSDLANVLSHPIGSGETPQACDPSVDRRHSPRPSACARASATRRS